MNNIQLNYEKLSRYTKDRIIVSITLLIVLISFKWFLYLSSNMASLTILSYFIFIPSFFIFITKMITIIGGVTNSTHSYKIIKNELCYCVRYKIKYKCSYIPLIYFNINEQFISFENANKESFRHSTYNNSEYKKYITKNKINIEDLEI